MMNNTYQTPRRDRRVDDRLKQTSPPHLIRNVVSSRVGGPNTENDELLAQYLANDMDSLTFDPPSDLDHLRDRNLEAVGAMHARMPSRGLRRDNVTRMYSHVLNYIIFICHTSHRVSCQLHFFCRCVIHVPNQNSVGIAYCI